MAQPYFNDRMRAIRWRMKREPFHLRTELRLIPRWYVRLVVVLYVVATGVVQLVNSQQPLLPELGKRLSALALAGITTGIAIPAACLLFLFCYVYYDAKRRQMRAVAWLLLAILVPDLIGVILYFLLREPLPYTCPQCGAETSGRFRFCPQCRYDLQEAAPSCPECKHEVRPEDRYCPYCGHDLAPARSPTITSPAPGAPA